MKWSRSVMSDTLRSMYSSLPGSFVHGILLVIYLVKGEGWSGRKVRKLNLWESPGGFPCCHIWTCLGTRIKEIWLQNGHNAWEQEVPISALGTVKPDPAQPGCPASHSDAALGWQSWDVLELSSLHEQVIAGPSRPQISSTVEKRCLS